jgi:hypothetical protein
MSSHEQRRAATSVLEMLVMSTFIRTIRPGLPRVVAEAPVSAPRGASLSITNTDPLISPCPIDDELQVTGNPGKQDSASPLFPIDVVVSRDSSCDIDETRPNPAASGRNPPRALFSIPFLLPKNFLPPASSLLGIWSAPRLMK